MRIKTNTMNLANNLNALNNKMLQDIHDQYFTIFNNKVMFDSKNEIIIMIHFN
jgi:hypothetical protein